MDDRKSLSIAEEIEPFQELLQEMKLGVWKK